MAKGKHVAPPAKRKSKKSLALIIALALVLTAAIGGTIAYLIDVTTEVVNVFEPTEVKCRVAEDFDGTVKSNVRVQNTGEIDAYIRATVVANWVNADGHVCAAHEAPVVNCDGTGWKLHDDGYYYYIGRVAPEGFTSNLIERCTLETSEVDNCTMQVEIIASAIQADPDNAALEAWGYVPKGSTGSGS
ncbi:MAG: hypothetical protein IJE09_02240 [Oscillospiraceae bacterium]|nr:hypothetical protein [Oscillospiraceae bacterium]